MTSATTNPSLVVLRRRFAALFGNEPPSRMRAAMLSAAIAWREQVLAHGDVEPALARDLAIIADEVRQARQPALSPDIRSPSPSSSRPVAPRRPKVAMADTPPPLPPASSQLRPGARLVRAYRGVTHVVEVTTDGFLHQGAVYASLSAVAKAITGTHWNGLLFFGLRRRRTAGGSTSAKRRRSIIQDAEMAHG